MRKAVKEAKAKVEDLAVKSGSTAVEILPNVSTGEVIQMFTFPTKAEAFEFRKMLDDKFSEFLTTSTCRCYVDACYK